MSAYFCPMCVKWFPDQESWASPEHEARHSEDQAELSERPITQGDRGGDLRHAVDSDGGVDASRRDEIIDRAVRVVMRRCGGLVYSGSLKIGPTEANCEKFAVRVAQYVMASLDGCDVDCPDHYRPGRLR